MESFPDKGSTFFFSCNFGIPLKTISKRLKIASDFKGKSVLIVDDNATSRIILNEYLTSFGFTSELAESAEEGFEQLRKKENSIDLVVMDWRMPGIDGITATKMIKEGEQGDNVPVIIMVTAYGREEIAESAFSAGVDGFLIKPVTPSMLFDSIMRAFGNGGDNSEIRLDSTGIPIGGYNGFKVLVAEDNGINQQVARELLEGFDLSVDIAENGRIALELIDSAKDKNKPYDLVFMDVQMPVLNGYEAANELRSRDYSLPIIAMTANAMVGDREKAINAGMNDYVAKPIDPVELYKAIGRSLGEPVSNNILNQEDIDTLLNSELDKLKGFNVKDGLYRVAGNQELYIELLLDFVGEFEDSAIRFEQMIKYPDKEPSRRLIHTIKGVSGNLGAMSLHIVATDLEGAVKKGDLNSVDRLFPFFKKELGITVKHIKESGLHFNKDDEGEKDVSGTIDIQLLIKLLDEFILHANNRKPKPANEVLRQFSNQKWPGDAQTTFDDITAMAKKYKLKEAADLASQLAADLKGR